VLVSGVLAHQPGYIARSQGHQGSDGICADHQFDTVPLRWCWRSTITASKVVTMFRFCHSHPLPCFFVRVRPGDFGRQVGDCYCYLELLNSPFLLFKGEQGDLKSHGTFLRQSSTCVTWRKLPSSYFSTKQICWKKNSNSALLTFRTISPNLRYIFIFLARKMITLSHFSISQGDPFNLDNVQSFILNLFVSARRDTRRSLYHHFTTAVDTENVNKVFGAVKNFILQGNLANLMLQWLASFLRKRFCFLKR